MKAVFVLCLLVVLGTFVTNVAGKQILYIKHAFFRLLIIFEVNFFQKFFQQYMYYQSDKKFRSRPGSKHDLDLNCFRVATVREKVLENEKFSRSGESQGITFSVREI